MLLRKRIAYGNSSSWQYLSIYAHQEHHDRIRRPGAPVTSSFSNRYWEVIVRLHKAFLVLWIQTIDDLRFTIEFARSRQKEACVCPRVKGLNRAHGEDSRLVHPKDGFHRPYDHRLNLVFCNPNGALLRVPFVPRFQHPHDTVKFFVVCIFSS